MDTRGARVLITDVGESRIWQEYVDPGDVSMGLPGMAGAVQAMKDTLPNRPRRTPRERMESMLQRVLPQMLAAYKETGKAEWPRSMQNVLDEIAKRDHDPTIAHAGDVEQVIRQGKALTRWLSETGARQQSLADYKQVTVEWAGH